MDITLNHGYTDIGRLYGECILYWMIENAIDGRDVDDYDMQQGSGLNNVEFKIGMDWLVNQRLLDRNEPILQ